MTMKSEAGPAAPRSGLKAARRRTAGIVAAAAAALALVLSGCSGQASPTTGGADGSSKSAGTLTLSTQIDNGPMDTAKLKRGNQKQYWQPVYDTLVLTSYDGEPQPNLATKWSYNDDHTVLTLTLRTDVKFTDGTPFDADAVKANIDYLKANPGQGHNMIKDVTVAVVSPSVVELHVPAPDPALLSYLGDVGGVMASPKAISSGTSDKNPVGSGPYVYDTKDTVPGSTYVYNRNTGYWNKDAYPYDKIVLKFMADETPRLNGLKTGQVQGGLLSAGSAAEAKASGLNVLTRSVNWAGLTIADRAGNVVPALGKVKVRQALNYAIDRESIVKNLLQGFGRPTDQVFNDKSPAYDKAWESTYTYDPAKAKQLLADAGYANGFTVTMPQSEDTYSALYPIIQDELAEIGVKVKWEQVPSTTKLSQMQQNKFPMYFLPLGSNSAWQDLQTWVAEKGTWNPGHSTDPELTKLLNEAQAASGAAQDEAFHNVGKWLLDNAWFVPMFAPENIYATTANVSAHMRQGDAVPPISSYTPAGTK